MPINQIGEYTSKCTVLTRNTKEDNSYQGRETFGFDIEFENGQKGIYQAKDQNNPKFKVGETFTFTVNKMTSEKNPEWSKIYIKKKQEPFSKGGYKQLSPEEQKSIAYQIASEIAIDTLELNLEGIDKLKEYTNYYLNWICEANKSGKEGQRVSGCIRLAMRLRKAVNKDLPNLKTHETITKYATQFFMSSNPENYK